MLSVVQTLPSLESTFKKLHNIVGLPSYCCVPCLIIDYYAKSTLKNIYILKHQVTSYYRGSNISFFKSLRTGINDSTRSKAMRVILFIVLCKVLRLINNSRGKEVKQ